MEKCQHNEIISMINKRMDKIEKKLDSVLKFKWVITGIFTAITAMCGATITIVNLL